MLSKNDFEPYSCISYFNSFLRMAGDVVLSYLSDTLQTNP